MRIFPRRSATMVITADCVNDRSQLSVEVGFRPSWTTGGPEPVKMAGPDCA
ncbi:hypothetical protein HMPREF9576_00326 [Cutibacterium acnes HL110PA2]|nr:hypothetical protein HMPREF9576_00326 [Cutibacterium acnes HL110PA2]